MAILKHATTMMMLWNVRTLPSMFVGGGLATVPALCGGRPLTPFPRQMSSATKEEPKQAGQPLYRPAVPASC